MALCTLNDVKAYLAIPVTKKDPDIDALLTSFVNRVSKRIETACDRAFESTAYTEYYNGEGSSYLYTNQYPIISITSIYDDSSWVWGSSTLISGTSYRISSDGRQVLLKDLHFYNYTENVKITYTAGYAEIPDDLVEAAALEVVNTFKNRKDPGVISKSLEDGSISRLETGFLPPTRITIERYKRKDIV